MLVPISINIDDLSQFNLTKQQTEEVIDFTIKEIVSSFASTWEATAKQELHSTREAYIKNLFVIDEGRMSGSVALSYADPLVRMIEEGISSFDQKIGFANSDKKKIKKDGGWFLTVPFKAGTPNTLADTGFSFIMPKEVYQTIKEKPVNPITNKATLTKLEVPSQYAIPTTRTAVTQIPTSKVFEEYKRKGSIYEGIVKTKDVVTGQNSYNSFRRVSDLSDDNSWIYPGMVAHLLAEKSFSIFESKLDIESTNALNQALDKLGI